MANFTVVDYVAGAMPWAGGLVPAVMTFRNVQKNLPQFELVEAGLIGVVVEGIGFVTITTTLDIWEAHQEEIKAAVRAKQPKPGMPAQFWVSLGGVVVYLVVVVAVNAILDDGNAMQKVTMGLMSSFGLLGGLMVALRNQLVKARMAALEAKAQADGEAQAERNRTDELEREQVAFERKIEEEKLHLEHEYKLKKLEEKARKDERKVVETFEKVEKPAVKVPETFGKWKDWRKLPESEKKVISGLERPEEVSELYGVSEKTASNWLANAKKEFSEGLVENV